MNETNFGLWKGKNKTSSKIVNPFKEIQHNLLNG